MPSARTELSRQMRCPRKEMSDKATVENRSASTSGSSMTPLWLMIGFSSVLMVFLGGDRSLYATLLGTNVSAGSVGRVRDPVCCSGFCAKYLPNLHVPIYDWIDAVSPAMILWTSLSSTVTIYRLYKRIKLGVPKLKDSVMFTEGAGMLLTLAQIVSFVWAVAVRDWITAALFAWWGPGFWVTVYYYLKAVGERRSIDWNQPCIGRTAASLCPISAIKRIPLKLPISWACKLAYVIYMVVFACMGLRWQLFAFSIWIINDQVSKLFLELDADRLRRTFDDKWLTRIAYPAGLFYPYFVHSSSLVGSDVTFLTFCRVFGVVMFITWIVGILFVSNKGLLHTLPKDALLLRNIMYFKPTQLKLDAKD